MPNIDNIIKSESIIKQHRIYRYDVPWTYCYGIDEEAEDAIETDPEAPVLVSKTYKEVILGANPIHYWRTDETVLGTVADLGSGNNAGTYGANVALQQPPAIIGDGDPGYSVMYGDTTYATRYVEVSNHDIGTVGSFYTQMSIEFWLKINDDISPTEDDQIILGKRATANSGDGRKNEFYFAIKRFDANNRFRLYFYGYSGNDPNNDTWNYNPNGVGFPSNAVYAPTTNYLTTGRWYHIVMTLNNGTRQLFVDGNRAGTSRLPAPIKKSSGVLRWGYLGSGFGNAWETEVAKKAINAAVPITYNIDEVAMYDYKLSDADILKHYQIGRDLYNITSVGGGGTGSSEISPCAGVITFPPSLTNEEDISDYVFNYSIDKDYQTLIETCALEVYADWGEDSIRTKLQSNAYVVIQERYKSIDENIDTGWLNVGHFLSDGAATKSLTAEGKKVYQIVLRSVLKLTSLDIVNVPLEGDKIFLPRREATQTANTTEIVKYQIPNPFFNGLYYENWAETPRLRAWVKNFTTTDDIVTATSAPIRIRGSEGSVQVVGGEGSLVIDKDFFTSKVKDGGLGYPTTTEIEFYRYATDMDIGYFKLVTSETYFSGTTITGAVIVVTDPDLMIDNTDNYIGRTLIVKSGASTGKLFKVVGVETRVGPQYGFHVQSLGNKIPDLSNIVWSVGDTIQIGDANLIEDVLMKILIRCGFQGGDPNKPFYFALERPSSPVIVPPSRYTFDDNVRWLELIQEVMAFAPPNYRIICNTNGHVVTLTATQKSVESGLYDHELLKVMDISQDRGDYGIFNRVVGIGQSATSLNVGLHTESGGYSSTGAYKLTNVYEGQQTGSTGVTKTQAEMDAIIKQIPDGNPKTPNLADNGYGILYNHKNSSTQRFTLEDSDMFWMDVGLNANGQDFLIDYLQFTVLPPYIDGQVIPQSLCVYYMTNEDYIQETGDIPPSASGDPTVATNLLALKDNDRWKLLVDEFECQEGQTSIGEGDFVHGKATRLRFLKVRCAQPYFRLQGGSSSVNVARIVLSDIKVWTSMKIVQYTQLGKTPPFDTDPHKLLFARLRRRTFVLDKNLYLDTAEKVHNFALNELRERYIEFSPYAISCFSPVVNIYDTVRLTDPETGVPKQFMVLGLRHQSNGMTQLQVTDYISGDNG